MFFKNICIIVLWMKVALALEGLTILSYSFRGWFVICQSFQAHAGLFRPLSRYRCDVRKAFRTKSLCIHLPFNVFLYLSFLRHLMYELLN